MLYEGFDEIGKDLRAFEDTMSNISDKVWEESAKCWGYERDDEIENKDWIQDNASRVPDPELPVTLIEQGFSTLHRTFDVFESFMEKQRRCEQEKVVEPAKPVHAQSEILDAARLLGKAVLEDQDPVRDNRSRKQSHSKGKVANATANALSAQENQVQTVKKPPKGGMFTRPDTAKVDAPTKGERVNKQIKAPARLANTQESRPTPTSGLSRKHAHDSQDSGRNDILPPSKRRAIFDEETHPARAPPTLPRREKASPRTPVRAQDLATPRRETSDYYRPSDGRRLASSDAERDRSLSLAPQGKFSAHGRDSTQRLRESPRAPSMCRPYSCENGIIG